MSTFPPPNTPNTKAKPSGPTAVATVIAAAPARPGAMAPPARDGTIVARAANIAARPGQGAARPGPKASVADPLAAKGRISANGVRRRCRCRKLT
jgi:hypothetical protein